MTQNQTSQNTSASNKIGNYLNFIVLIVMVLALAAIFIAVTTLLSTDQITANDLTTAGILGAIGLIAMSLSVFLLYQSRRQSAQVKIDIPKVMTTVECQNKGCSNKTVREFQRGDYVFKEVDTPCTKCGAKQMITAIYKEVKEKEKTYAV
jgi:hypothetical protein